MMYVLFFVLGSVLASFYGVVATRLVEGKSIIKPRSHCNDCNHELSWYELIPIFSFLFLKGKCHKCHKKLPIYEPIMELSLGLGFLGSYMYYGFSYELWISLILMSLFLLIYVSDFKYMIILDSPLIISSILLIVLKYFEVGLKNTGIAIIYGIVLFVFMYLIKLLGDKIFKRESLGGGDIKLCFIIGLTLGYYGVGFRMSLICIIFSAFLALPYAIASFHLNKKNELPYGPFLIFSLVIIFIFFKKFYNLLVFFTLI